MRRISRGTYVVVDGGSAQAVDRDTVGSKVDARDQELGDQTLGGNDDGGTKII